MYKTILGLKRKQYQLKYATNLKAISKTILDMLWEVILRKRVYNTHFPEVIIIEFQFK